MSRVLRCHFPNDAFLQELRGVLWGLSAARSMANVYVPEWLGAIIPGLSAVALGGPHFQRREFGISDC